MSSELIALIQRLGQPRILVIGDIILDRYTFGFAERVSPEAPVLVLRADKQEDRLGGAASVANMLARLGAQVALASVLGCDGNAPRLRSLLAGSGLSADLLVTDPERPTTLKERYIGRAQDRHPQQILRVDFESRAPLTEELETRLLACIDAHLGACDIVLISDYDKGVCTPRLLRHVIDGARMTGRRVLVDPIRTRNYARYHGATCLTPNRTEAHLATGLPVATPAEALVAADRLRQQLDAEAVVVTLDKEGMALAHADGRQQIFATRPRQVYDITGAGDMVLSVLGLALAAGADYEAAIGLGNVAGGLEVERLGVATLTREDLLGDLAGLVTPADAKAVALPALLPLLEQRRRQGAQIVFTNGCFDVLHAGHVRYLQQARALGQLLVVGLNSDASVRRLKGPTRPLNPLAARAEVLAGLACVDYVVAFDEDTPLRLIENLAPDVLVKGADYRLEQIVGRDFVERRGGQVRLIPLLPGHSTTRLAAHVHGTTGAGTLLVESR